VRCTHTKRAQATAVLRLTRVTGGRLAIPCRDEPGRERSLHPALTGSESRCHSRGCPSTFFATAPPQRGQPRDHHVLAPRFVDERRRIPRQPLSIPARPIMEDCILRLASHDSAHVDEASLCGAGHRRARRIASVCSSIQPPREYQDHEASGARTGAFGRPRDLGRCAFRRLLHQMPPTPTRLPCRGTWTLQPIGS
jgi:hypothetical protein